MSCVGNLVKRCVSLCVVVVVDVSLGRPVEHLTVFQRKMSSSVNRGRKDGVKVKTGTTQK